jgi:predicted lipoprotein with Yx(FWY)xxD motif
LVTVIGLVLSGAVALAQPKLSAGRVTSHTGLTLYTFDNDSAGSGKSVCNAPCSNIFAPYLVEPGARAGRLLDHYP